MNLVSLSRIVTAVAPLFVATMVGSLPAASPTLAEVEQAFHSGDYQQVLELSQEQVDKGIWNERWPRWLIRCQLVTGQYDAARKTYLKAIRRYPTSLTLRLLGIEALRASGENDFAAKEEQQFFRVLQRSPSRYTSRENLIAAGRYFLSQGEDARQVLKLFYDRVREADPRHLEAFIATAELAIDKGDYQEAADTLARAEQLQPGDPRVFYLSARAWAPSEPQRAETALGKALEINPHHIPSLLLKADSAIDGEQYETAEQLIEEVLETNPQHPKAIALKAVIAHLRGDYQQERTLRDLALQSWSENPVVDHTIGKQLSEKYRFAEGAAYQRQALQFDPDYLPAKLQLAQDLLRLGNNEEGWKIADQVAEQDQYNVVAHNLITLHDRLKDFSILEADGIHVRMDADEAKVYGDEVLQLLSEAKVVLCEKYDVQPELPIVVEIFPQQKDFAIRTFGLPGGAGFLGVCFGRVITANSPASQGERPTNWKSVLWHEFCHVVTLEKTNNRMPRWLSEGISVYEERQRNPNWGESMTPRYREMLLDDDLTPVSELSAAFLRPPSPVHLQFAYFHSSLVVEFLIDQYGIDALKAILDELGDGVTINAALEKSVGSLQKLDVEFVEHAKRVAGQFAPEADWARPESMDSLDIQRWKQWVAEHSDSYWGWRQLGQRYMAAGEYEQARTALEKLRSLGAVTAQRNGPLEWLAKVYAALETPEKEVEVLQQIVSLSSDALPALRRLAELAEQDGRWNEVLEYGQQMAAIHPLLPGVQATIARAAEATRQFQYAVSALSSLKSMNPVDPAALDYRLAAAHYELQQYGQAKHHVLRALDEAPRYRDAHRLLLQIVNTSGNDAEQLSE